MFGWLIVGCLFYVCPNAMGQTVFSGQLLGAGASDPELGGILAQNQAPVAFVVTSASVTIAASGKWKSTITGLVVPTVGTGGITQIAEALVCGGKIVANTESVALSTAGNAKIKTTVTGIPSRCVAPAVFVYVTEIDGVSVGLTSTPPTQYIAVTGFTTSSSTDSDPPEGNPEK